MSKDIIKLLSERNDTIADMQKNRPLIIKGHSPFKLYMKGNLKGKVLTDIYFYDKKYDKKRVASNVHTETLSIFSPFTVLHKNQLIPIGETKLFEIDINEHKSIMIKNFDSKLKAKLFKFIEFSSYDYLHIFENNNHKIIVPAYTIGNYFYYPNSYIKRAFFAQDISLLVEEGLTDCKNGAVCFAGTHIKFTKINAVLGYLYYCDKLARGYFYHSFSYFFKEKIKVYEDKKRINKLKNDFIWLNPKFVFPCSQSLNTPVKILFRTVEIDENIFLALEILDFDFKKLLGKEEITAFYESRERVNSMKLKYFSSGKANISSLSHTQAYNSDYELASIEILKEIPESIDEFCIKKGKAVCRGEYIYSKSIKNSFEKSEGLTLDDERDPNSRYAKGYVSKLDFDFKKAMKLLEKRLNIEGKTKFIDEFEYFGFLFWWNGRNYFVLELKNFDAYTLLFSSVRAIDYKDLAKTILDIKKGNVQKSYKKLRKELDEERINFHTPQKHVGEDLDKWVERLVGKISIVNN